VSSQEETSLDGDREKFYSETHISSQWLIVFSAILMIWVCVQATT